MFRSNCCRKSTSRENHRRASIWPVPPSIGSPAHRTARCEWLHVSSFTRPTPPQARLPRLRLWSLCRGARCAGTLPNRRWSTVVPPHSREAAVASPCSSRAIPPRPPAWAITDDCGRSRHRGIGVSHPIGRRTLDVAVALRVATSVDAGRQSRGGQPREHATAPGVGRWRVKSPLGR